MSKDLKSEIRSTGCCGGAARDVVDSCCQKNSDAEAHAKAGCGCGHAHDEVETGAKKQSGCC